MRMELSQPPSEFTWLPFCPGVESIFIDYASELFTIMLSNTIILSGWVPHGGLSCTEGKCALREFIIIRRETEMFKRHHEQPLRSVISCSGLWSSAVWNVCYHVWPLSTAVCHVWMGFCIYSTCMCVFLRAVHVRASLRWFLINGRCYGKVLL